MSDSESIKKMLRSVLQSSKAGVSISTLQSEYRSLCGESIPLRKLGYSQLEDYLRSIPSVVRLEHRMGEVRMKCFAAVCRETAHIAELVAKQKSSKKSGRSQFVNCKMRFKPSNPYMLNVRPRSSLRQPSARSASNWSANRSWSRGGYRGFSNKITKLLEKYNSGLWMSKLSEVYSEMFGQKLHPQALVDLKKWTHIVMELKSLSFLFCLWLVWPSQVEQPSSTNRADHLIFPPLPPKPCVTFSPTSDSVPCPPVLVSAEVRERLKELLSKYRQGLWAHALPKLFMDTYKTPFPEHVLNNLSLLLDICTVEYPMPHDKKKAILYNSSIADMEATYSQESQQCRSHPLPSGLEVLGPMVPPCLVLPSEQYPSVLITDAKGSNAVTVRYVGENYSNAQEAMEEAMQSFYSQSSTHHPLSKPVVGQLVAVRGEDGEELARAQVMEVTTLNRFKVYYVDYGFSVETSGTNLLELHQDFLSLPFQAISVRLAGLEAFSSHPLVLSTLDKLAVGKILLMETLEPCQHNETPVALLYDTSQADDININSICLKVLQDVTMNNPLTVNATYRDVHVTNVCADGIIYCQLPSRGTARLSKLLEETETFFISQMTSESLVSRPFSGKFCLARYKGMWSRVEITNMYGNRVIEILYIDLGVTATVEVTDLREIPPLFLKNFTIIPPLAIKCRLADVTVPEGDWSPEAVLWVKEAVLGSEDCKMKVTYCNITNKYSTKPCGDIHLILLPVFFQPGQNMDVFVPVACHPGYFVLQPWQDLHKLVVLMGEMILYYNQTLKTNPAPHIQRGEIYAAKIVKNWHRVQVKGILSNGLVSVFELDYGKHELVRSTLLRPLIEEFRQLPFQAITAQLAGTTQQHWSEEASMLFRNHVEDRALVALVESVSEVKGEMWERKLTVYLVDTTLEDKDLWIHSIMADISGELSSAA
uniref:Tudor domain containing 7 a n=1 Tax=Sander lucioperca TaxID=283035 RepID=A0A8C9XVT4_SANLU